ncbi:MAG: Ubiquitin-conjugating enzyme E2 6 [Sclerophora amabilis]|nr:MAG: Ubiquitin-conjugating enzyme E2 6 [Sclerophora amabilis]
MATRAANKRLAREYKAIQENPPPYIIAHPSEKNILEWHYILTGPPQTPYYNGQYWGTLIFPPDYPFAPPAIRMHTPSGRFQPSTRLCLSISDFHPKSFNPAWEVSTILIGLMSFMTSDEMTTGSVSASEAERKWAAGRTRWWNSTGGGSSGRTIPELSKGGVGGSTKGSGNVKAGDGGVKFRSEWAELDDENWRWMKENRIDPATGNVVPELEPDGDGSNGACLPEAAALRRRPGGSTPGLGAVMEGGQAARNAGQGWLRRHKMVVAVGVIFGYVLIARLMGEDATAP